MAKNGLFLLSIGCLILLFTANAQTGSYDIFSMTTALFFIAVGGFMVWRDKKKDKQQKNR